MSMSLCPCCWAFLQFADFHLAGDFGIGVGSVGVVGSVELEENVPENQLRPTSSILMVSVLQNFLLYNSNWTSGFRMYFDRSVFYCVM